MSLIREHAELVTEALRSREDSQKQLREMYTDLTSKQNKEILDLRKRLNDEGVFLNVTIKLLRTDSIRSIYSLVTENMER